MSRYRHWIRLFWSALCSRWRRTERLKPVPGHELTARYAIRNAAAEAEARLLATGFLHSLARVAEAGGSLEARIVDAGAAAKKIYTVQVERAVPKPPFCRDRSVF